MEQNLPTYFLDSGAVTARNAEYPGTPFTDTGGGTYSNPWLGCNRAAGNAPGIGIATGVVNPKASDWPAVADTAAHESQHIGEDGAGAAMSDDINVIAGTDVNNEVAFVQADASTANDAEADSATGATNQTGATVAQDDWIWGVVPIA